MSQTPSRFKVKPRKPVTYQLTITNRGELTAPGVVLADTFPAKTFKARRPAGCVIRLKKKPKKHKGRKKRKAKLRSMRCALGDIAPGASTTVPLTSARQSGRGP